MAEAARPEEKGPDLEKLRRMVDEAMTLKKDERKEAEKNRDYYDSEQLDETQKAVLHSRKQPQNIYNRIAPAINGILGVVVQGKTDPRAFMRNPPKQPSPPPSAALMSGAAPGPLLQPAAQPNLDAGDVATMTLRYVADSNRFPSLKIDVLENMCVEGSGGCIIEVDEQREIKISHVRWEEFFYDPRSRKPDFSDARYMGFAKWMYADDVKALYPGKETEIDGAFGTGAVLGGTDQSWLDRPEDAQNRPAWVDSKTSRLQVVEKYYREGNQWLKCCFIASAILASGPSAYVDEKNRPINPMEMQSAFVDRKLNRYGQVRSMRGPQDDINMRRIKAVHEINTRQIQQADPNAPPIDADLARSEAARPDGVIPPGWQVVPRNDVVANNLDLLQEAKSEIERMGPVPAILGRQNASASGRADQVKQQAGMTELARLLDRFRDWEMRVYRQIWARCRQFWDEPKWIRVTNDDGAPQYVMVNEPEYTTDPMTGQQVVSGMKNHIAKMDVDIVVDNVPDTATLEQEIFSELIQLAQAYVGTPQQIPFPMLVEMSPLPKKREIVKKLEEAQAKQMQANAPVMALEAEGKKAEIIETQSKAQKNFADSRQTEVETVRSAMQGHAEALNPHVMAPPMQQPNGAMSQ